MPVVYHLPMRAAVGNHFFDFRFPRTKHNVLALFLVVCAVSTAVGFLTANYF
jgi:hypothetical protein